MGDVIFVLVLVVAFLLIAWAWRRTLEDIRRGERKLRVHGQTLDEDLERELIALYPVKDPEAVILQYKEKHLSRRPPKKDEATLRWEAKRKIVRDEMGIRGVEDPGEALWEFPCVANHMLFGFPISPDDLGLIAVMLRKGGAVQKGMQPEHIRVRHGKPGSVKQKGKREVWTYYGPSNRVDLRFVLRNNAVISIQGDP